MLDNASVNKKNHNNIVSVSSNKINKKIVLRFGVLTKVNRDRDKMKRRERINRKGKSQTRDHKKIPLTLSLVFQSPSTLASDQEDEK